MRMIPLTILAMLALSLSASPARAQGSASTEILPDASGPWKAVAPVARYDTKTIYEYLDGGAEIYLAYGMSDARARRYVCAGEPGIEATVFTMDEPAGAFGVFTYEHLDDDAKVGQGSEYGGGILRFWQGHAFVFIQAEAEGPEVHAAVIALGKHIAAQCGPPAPVPKLATVLPTRGRRPRTLRYTLTPTVLQNLEPTFAGNPLELPPLTPAVLGRYGQPRDKARILVMSLPDSVSAERCASTFRQRFIEGRAADRTAAHVTRGKSLTRAVRHYCVLVLDMPRAAVARRHLQEITTALRRIQR